MNLPDVDEETVLSFESVEDGLDEIKHVFEREQSRTTALERKLSGLLALNAIIISVVSTATWFSIWSKLLIVGISLGSAAQGLRTLRAFEYERPLEKPENIFSYFSLNSKMFSYEIFKLYLVSVKHNRSVNDTRYEMYQTSLILILVAIVALVFLSFGEYFVSAFAAPKASSEAVNKSYMFDMFQ